MASNPVDAWKETVTKLKVGDVFVYHKGHLGADAERSPSLRNIQIFAYGLYLMGRVGLRQAHTVQSVKSNEDGVEVKLPITTYSFKVIDRINRLDFDTARKAYLSSLEQV